MALIPATHAARPTGDGRHRERTIEGLLDQLQNTDPTVRRWAVRDLMAVEDVSAALVTALHLEVDVAVRGVLLTALATRADGIAVDGLVACLRSENAALRNEAIGAMQQLPTQVASIMGALLLDDDPDVRILAVNVLESLRHPDVEEWLIEVIEHDPHLNVCATAVDLLGEVGSLAARGPLERLKARFGDAPYIGFATDLALSRIVDG